MLSSHERRGWHDVERRHTVETEELTWSRIDPPHRGRLWGRGLDDLPAAFVAGIWSGIALVLLGFVVAGLAVGTATTVAALLWRWWPLLRD